MKILILSDTHGNLGHTRQIFENLHNAVEMVIHLGDCYADMKELKEQYAHLDFRCILGNCDFHGGRKREDQFVINHKSILITHGERHSVKSGYDEIISYAHRKSADICLFGHTHCPTIQRTPNVLLMNPGSPSLPRGVSFSSYGILDIAENGEVCASIVGKLNGVYKVVDAISF